MNAGRLMINIMR